MDGVARAWGESALKARAAKDLGRRWAADAQVWHLYDNSTESGEIFDLQCKVYYRAFPQYWREHSYVLPFPGGYVTRNEYNAMLPDGTHRWFAGMQLTFLNEAGETYLFEEYMDGTVHDTTAPLWGETVTVDRDRPQPRSLEGFRAGGSPFPAAPSIESPLPDGVTDEDCEALGEQLLASWQVAQSGAPWPSTARVWRLFDSDEVSTEQLELEAQGFAAEQPSVHAENRYVLPFPGGYVTRLEYKGRTPAGDDVWLPGATLTFLDDDLRVSLVEEYYSSTMIASVLGETRMVRHGRSHPTGLAAAFEVTSEPARPAEIG